MITQFKKFDVNLPGYKFEILTGTKSKIIKYEKAPRVIEKEKN